MFRAFSISIFIFPFFLTISVLGQTVGTAYRLLMVDQDGVVNPPGVLASPAQMSTNAAEVAIATAKAEAAMAAAAEGTNLVADIIEQIGSNELVVYRQGMIDSVAPDAAVLPPGTRCTVTRFAPLVGTEEGLIVNRIKYATSGQADGIAPDILYADTLEQGRGGMMPLPPDRVGVPARLDESYTSPDGTSYPYVYQVDVKTAPSASGFFIVHLDGEASADGTVFEIHGGIAGGATATVEWGGRKLTFTGGLLTGVEEVTP